MLDISKKTIQSYSAGVSKAGAIKLSSNESPFPPSPAVQEAMMEAMRNAHRYPNMEQVSLKTALAMKHKVNMSSIILGNGSGEILSFIARCLLGPTNEVIISENTFSLYAITSQIAGAFIKTVPLLDGYCNLEGMTDAITTRTAVIFLPNPNNPTGTAHTKEKMLAFLASLPPQVYVVLDEAYMDFADSIHHIEINEIFTVHERSIVLRTFSKLFALGGMRLGYGISTPEITQILEQAKLPFSINCVVSAAAHAVLDDTVTQEKNLSYIRAERTSLTKIFQDMQLSFFPTQANFFCIAIAPVSTRNHEKTHADSAFDFFSNNNIMIRALTSFGMPNHIRITIGTQAENKEACTILEKFAQDA